MSIGTFWHFKKTHALMFCIENRYGLYHDYHSCTMTVSLNISLISLNNFIVLLTWSVALNPFLTYYAKTQKVSHISAKKLTQIWIKICIISVS